MVKSMGAYFFRNGALQSVVYEGECFPPEGGEICALIEGPGDGVRRVAALWASPVGCSVGGLVRHAHAERLECLLPYWLDTGARYTLADCFTAAASPVGFDTVVDMLQLFSEQLKRLYLADAEITDVMLGEARPARAGWERTIVVQRQTDERPYGDMRIVAELGTAMAIQHTMVLEPNRTWTDRPFDPQAQLRVAYLRWRREMRAHHRRDKACEEALLRRLRRRLKDAAVYRIDYTNATFRVVPQGSKYAVHLHVDPWPVASLAYYVTHVIVVDAATDGLVYETGCHSGRIDGALTKGLRTITQLPRG